MDAKFRPAVKAIQSGDLDKLEALIAADPTLATSRSSTSHPTLLQCLALEAKHAPINVAMANVLINGGADVNEPLVAAASGNNRAVAEVLLDRGAVIDGVGSWSPLEEALYWNSQDVLTLLLERGARIRNLRTAAGLGRIEIIESYFDSEDQLKPEAGKINWPWGSLDEIERSNQPAAGKRSLVARVKSWSQDRQGIINNAFVYACMHGHCDAAKFLLGRGAEINSIPGGFDFAGSGLHYAALNGHRDMVEFLLERGADRALRDTKVGSTPSGWAEHGGHPTIRDLLL